MNKIQLSQDWRATKGNSLLLTTKSQEVCGSLEGWKAESNLELLSVLEPETPRIGIQHPNHYTIIAPYQRTINIKLT